MSQGWIKEGGGWGKSGVEEGPQGRAKVGVVETGI